MWFIVTNSHRKNLHISFANYTHLFLFSQPLFIISFYFTFRRNISQFFLQFSPKPLFGLSFFYYFLSFLIYFSLSFVRFTDSPFFSCCFSFFFFLFPIFAIFSFCLSSSCCCSSLWVFYKPTPFWDVGNKYKTICTHLHTKPKQVEIAWDNVTTLASTEIAFLHVHGKTIVYRFRIINILINQDTKLN